MLDIFKSLFCTIVDGITVEEKVKLFVKNETSKWDGYIPVEFNLQGFNKMKVELLKSGVDVESSHSSFMLDQAEFLVKCPKVAVKHLIMKDKVRTIEALAKRFNVSQELMLKCLKHYGWFN